MAIHRYQELCDGLRHYQSDQMGQLHKALQGIKERKSAEKTSPYGVEKISMIYQCIFAPFYHDFIKKYPEIYNLHGYEQKKRRIHEQLLGLWYQWEEEYWEITPYDTHLLKKKVAILRQLIPLDAIMPQKIPPFGELYKRYKEKCYQAVDGEQIDFFLQKKSYERLSKALKQLRQRAHALGAKNIQESTDFILYKVGEKIHDHLEAIELAQKKGGQNSDCICKGLATLAKIEKYLCPYLSKNQVKTLEKVKKSLKNPKKIISQQDQPGGPSIASL